MMSIRVYKKLVLIISTLFLVACGNNSKSANMIAKVLEPGEIETLELESKKQIKDPEVLAKVIFGKFFQTQEQIESSKVLKESLGAFSMKMDHPNPGRISMAAVENKCLGGGEASTRYSELDFLQMATPNQGAVAVSGNNGYSFQVLCIPRGEGDEGDVCSEYMVAIRKTMEDSSEGTVLLQLAVQESGNGFGGTQLVSLPVGGLPEVFAELPDVGTYAEKSCQPPKKKKKKWYKRIWDKVKDQVIDKVGDALKKNIGKIVMTLITKGAG